MDNSVLPNIGIVADTQKPNADPHKLATMFVNRNIKN